MVSVDGLLDAHEVAVRARVEELRVLLADAERDREHVAITRHTLRVVVANRAAVSSGGRGSAGQGPVMASGVVVPSRREGMTEQVLTEGYRGLCWRAGRLVTGCGPGSWPARWGCR